LENHYTTLYRGWWRTTTASPHESAGYGL